MAMSDAGRQREYDVDPMFLGRWSPRAFTAEPIPERVLMSVFEAAHWAPSAFNLQPWRFVYAHRDGPGWETLLGLLIPYNQAWAQRAAALVFAISHRFRRRPSGELEPIYSHSFDTGAAWGYLALQAHRLGWAAHGMTGFDHEGCYAALGVPEDEYRVEAAIALGRQADKAILPDSYQSREAPSDREPVSQLVFEGRFEP
ncbi:MAG TPA: nitroreductase family protein [Caulobacteraceae bacterium]|nr:nitroreductase family protein [Caulobacteraceae bacterium]